MDSARWERMQALFQEAVARPKAEQRVFVETACVGDGELLAELLTMLEADSRSASLLDRGLPEMASRMIGAPGDSVSSREFGPYRLERILGEGGMGVVWLAERKDTGHLVAIKFLPHAGMSPARRERFAREIKTLAKLKHPYIARLYDAGTLADGTPWFVMEYVDGTRFAEYSRAAGRTTAEKLRLFRMVCEAVQHAHGQEIIHRDLKPSNILVERDGTPRLLDFGIARQLHSIDEAADQTRPGMRFLSPDYAAPEWERDGTVGSFTDVYSLGVILHEMLVGRLPRKEAPETEGAGVQSDLDLLCFKARHPDAGERYRSVEALVRDLDHYSKGEPIEARPDTLRYRLGKFVRRNRRMVLATSLTLALLVGLVVFFTLRLARARNTALAEAARARSVEKFMANLFQGGDKEAGPTGDLRVLTLLDRGVQEASTLRGEPAVQAELYETLGSMYQKLGKFDRADSLLHSALERRRSIFRSDEPEVAESLLAIGLLQKDQAHLPEAERTIRQALAMSQNDLPADSMAAARATDALGRVLNERGEYGKAIETLNEAVRIQSGRNEAEADLAATLIDLADAHFYLGHYAIADTLNRRALAMHRQLYGERHPLVGYDWRNLGQIQIQLGHYAEAEKYSRQALAINKSWYGKDHPETADSAIYLAQSLRWQGRNEEAKALLERALVSMERAYGKVHPRVALVLGDLGTVAFQLGKLDEAEADFSRMAEIYRSVYGDQHQMTAVALANLASVYLKKKQYPRAEKIFRDAIGRFTKTQGADHLNTGIARIKLGRALLCEKRYQEAEGETLAGYKIVTKQTSPSVTWLQSAREDLIAEYEALKQPARAAPFRSELTKIAARH